MNILQTEEFSKFKEDYKIASDTLNNPINKFYLDLLTECYNDEKVMNFIEMANDYLKVPPVKSFAKVYEERIKEYEKNTNNFQKEDTKMKKTSKTEESIEIKNPAIKQSIGAWFGFIFKEFKNREVKSRVRIGGILGITTAALFTK